MSLTAGTRLGPYEILSAIGAGGMGEVYRARDTKLHRDVAIKVLPDLFADDPERLARFEREAQVLASLNHSNIAHVYGVEDLPPTGGSYATAGLVMELVEGEDLAQRLARGPIPVDEALAIARQIADALEAAHQHGIVHRDLKPANIKVGPDGTVKVLDFGLAKALDTAGVSATADAVNSPTFTARATQQGMIVGTAAYMAPEQARGKAIDTRADIWAFGCVLYEMLGGGQTFGGDTITDVLAAVVRQEPDWSMLPADTPPAVRRLLWRCLQKDPSKRLRDIGDARLELEDGGAAAAVWAGGAPTQLPLIQRALPWTLAAVFAVAALAMMLRPAPSSRPADASLHVALPLPPGVEFFGSPVTSRDGSVVAFVGVRDGVRQVFVRRLGDFETMALQSTTGTSTICLSPDGQSVALVGSDHRLVRIAIGDGVVQQVVTNADFLAGLTWAPDDTIVFGRDGRLMTVPSAGGEPRELTPLDTAHGEVGQRMPVVAPGSDLVLFTSLRGTDGSRTRIEAVSRTDSTRHVVVEDAAQAIWFSSSRLIFTRDKAVLEAPFALARRETSGLPVKVLEDVGVSFAGSRFIGVSDTGLLVFATSGISGARLVWVKHDGAERALGGAPRAISNPRLAPDGRAVVFTDSESVWSLDLERGAIVRLAANASYPVVLPDSRHVVVRPTPGTLALVDTEGGGRMQPIPGTTVNDFAASVSPDGATLAVVRLNPTTAGDIYLVPLQGSGAPKPWLATKAYEGAAQFSPDGRWMVYTADDSGRPEVYLRGFPGPDRRWPVSIGGGLHPLWNRNGRQIFYRDGQKMMVVDVVTSPSVSLHQPRPLFERQYYYGSALTIPSYSYDPATQQFLMIKQEGGFAHLNLITNWLQHPRK